MIKRRFTPQQGLYQPLTFVCFETEGAAWPRPPGKPRSPRRPLPPLTFSSICRSCSSPAASSCSSSFSMAGVITTASACSPISAPSGSATSARSLIVTPGRTPAAPHRCRCPSCGRALPSRGPTPARAASPPASREQKPRATQTAREAAPFSRGRPLRPPGPCEAVSGPGRLRARAARAWGARAGPAETGRAVPLRMGCQGSQGSNPPCRCLWEAWMWHLAPWSSCRGGPDDPRVLPQPKGFCGSVPFPSAGARGCSGSWTAAAARPRLGPRAPLDAAGCATRGRRSARILGGSARTPAGGKPKAGSALQ